MEKLNKAFFSRTVWMIVIMFLVGGLQAIEHVLTPTAFITLQGLLSLTATFYKLNPSQKYE